MRQEIVELKESVRYQPGSVVSKEILRSGSGTLTVFAFDAGQGLSEHTAPFDALVLVLEGQAEVKIGGTGHSLSAGQSIIMPANQPHALSAPGRFKMLLAMLK